MKKIKGTVPSPATDKIAKSGKVKQAPKAKAPKIGKGPKGKKS